MRCTGRAGHTAEPTLSKLRICLLTKAGELPAGGAERCEHAVVKPGLVELELWGRGHWGRRSCKSFL